MSVACTIELLGYLLGSLNVEWDKEDETFDDQSSQKEQPVR